MKIKPLANRIIVQCDDAPEIKSTLFIPDAAKTDKPTRGTVVAVGPGKLVKGKLQPVNIAVGDIVLFPRGTGVKVTIEKQDFYTMTDDDIVGIVTQSQ